jgi:beta-xylosidase
MLLRKDVRRHLLMCRDELGLRHVACRGILGDEMNVIGGDGSFSFDAIEPVMDWMLENGLIPFLRLAEPEARPDTPAAARWRELVTALATHVDARYGCDAREWYFEIVPSAGTGDAPGDRAPGEEFQGFDSVVSAIKQVHPEYRVGWHVIGAAEPLDKALAHIAAPPEGNQAEAPRCDFLTIEGGDAPSIGAIREKLSAAWGKGAPLIVLGWGDDAASQSAFAPDECRRAAFIARQAVAMTDVCQGVITNNISDIDTAPGAAGYEPFHHGRGLITVNDVRKGAFHALRLLNEHGGYHGERLASRWTDAPAGLGCLATRSEHTLRLLLWLDQCGGSAAPARLTLEGLPASVSDAQIEVIRPGAGSAFEAWTKLGKPQFVNREILDALEVASLPAQANVDFREYPPRLEPGMVMQMTINLPYDDLE